MTVGFKVGWKGFWEGWDRFKDSGLQGHRGLWVFFRGGAFGGTFFLGLKIMGEDFSFLFFQFLDIGSVDGI